MNTDAFSKKLMGDESAVSRDESKLSRDESKLDAFASKLGVGPDLRLAQNDAGDAATVRNALAPSMADWGGPQLGAPAEHMGGGPSPNGDQPPIHLPYGQYRVDPSLGHTPGSVPLSQTPQASGIPRGPGGPPPDYITNPNAYRDPSMATPPGTLARPPVAPPAGGGGDFGVGAANKAVLGTYDDQRSHMQQGAMQHAEAMRGNAAGLDQHAAMLEQRAKQQEEMRAVAAKKDSEYMAASDKMNQAYMSGEIDPNRAFHNADTGTKVAMGIAAFLGAFVPGVKPLSKLVFGSAEEDAAAQKDKYDRMGQGLKNRDSMFGHFMKISGDPALAQLQTTSALIDASKAKLQAQADRLGIPEAMTNAKIGIDGLTREQKTLQKQIAQQSAAAASAHAGALMARQDKERELLWKRQMDVAELGLKKDELALKTATGKPQTEAEKKREETQGELNAQLKAFSSKLDPVKGGGLWDSGVAGSLPGWAPGVESAKKGVSDLKTHNTKLMVAGGAAYRWGSGGMEPKNQEVIKELMAPFELHPGDSAQTRRDKTANFVEYMKQQAAAHGAVAPDEAPEKVNFTPDKR